MDLVADGDRVATTQDHPFWNESDQEWQRADQLDEGDWLLGPDGELVVVGGVLEGSTRWGTAYNLTVDDLHTYYVAIDDTPVLVHNTCADPFENLHGPFAIDAGKQSLHIAGSDRYLQRIASGKPSSTFLDPSQADVLVRDAWHFGTPNTRNPAERTFDFRRPVGNSGFSGTQTRVTAVMGKNGRLHGFLSGRSAI